jgi:hypothetical protein
VSLGTGTVTSRRTPRVQNHMGEGPGSTVPVTRPIAVRQLAAGLATAAAVVAAGGLGLSLDTVRYGGGDSTAPASITRLAWGERVSSTITGGFQYASWRWGGPLVLAVVLLVAAAACALVAARLGDRGPWARLGQLLAIGGGALVVGLVAVLWVVGASDVSSKDHTDWLGEGEGVTTQWGPLMAALVLAVVLAAGAAVLVRRGRSVVVATVQVTA